MSQAQLKLLIKKQNPNLGKPMTILEPPKIIQQPPMKEFRRKPPNPVSSKKQSKPGVAPPTPKANEKEENGKRLLVEKTEDVVEQNSQKPDSPQQNGNALPVEKTEIVTKQNSQRQDSPQEEETPQQMCQKPEEEEELPKENDWATSNIDVAQQEPKLHNDRKPPLQKWYPREQARQKPLPQGPPQLGSLHEYPPLNYYHNGVIRQQPQHSPPEYYQVQPNYVQAAVLSQPYGSAANPHPSGYQAWYRLEDEYPELPTSSSSSSAPYNVSHGPSVPITNDGRTHMPPPNANAWNYFTGYQATRGPIDGPSTTVTITPQFNGITQPQLSSTMEMTPLGSYEAPLLQPETLNLNFDTFSLTGLSVQEPRQGEPAHPPGYHVFNASESQTVMLTAEDRRHLQEALTQREIPLDIALRAVIEDLRRERLGQGAATHLPEQPSQHASMQAEYPPNSNGPISQDHNACMEQVNQSATAYPNGDMDASGYPTSSGYSGGYQAQPGNGYYDPNPESTPSSDSSAEPVAVPSTFNPPLMGYPMYPEYDYLPGFGHIRPGYLPNFNQADYAEDYVPNFLHDFVPYYNQLPPQHFHPSGTSNRFNHPSRGNMQ
ncbi:altered inheritance of mitochondria protein 3 [Drosophila ficusphila]|uniref:altered inheritance of mitochondria protein 3 n=1 Tax=Drosophila ficusphila TaxID=30025 RepID=UPI0007E7BB8B|nr:altered inheritance of mitochondria protein 3 [Drosophila ficusphila]